MYHTAQSFAESNFVFAGSPCIDWEYKFLNFFKGLAYQKFPLRVVSHCEESNFSNFEFEYVRENEIFSKTIFAGLSGSQVCSIHEKNRGRKFRDTASLNDSVWSVNASFPVIADFYLSSYITLNGSFTSYACLPRKASPYNTHSHRGKVPHSWNKFSNSVIFHWPWLTSKQILLWVISL